MKGVLLDPKCGCDKSRGLPTRESRNKYGSANIPTVNEGYDSSRNVFSKEGYASGNASSDNNSCEDCPEWKRAFWVVLALFILAVVVGICMMRKKM